MPTPLVSIRPFLKIKRDDHELVATNLLALRIDEQEGGLVSAELRLSNLRPDPSGDSRFAFGDDAVFALGASLEIGMGDEASPTPLFHGTVTALGERFATSAPPELVVSAEDALLRARLARRTQVYTDATLDAVGRVVADRMGGTWRNDGASVSLGTVTQLAESDLAFLRRLLAAHDIDVHLDGRVLVAAPIVTRRVNEVEKDAQEDFLACEVSADLAHQVSEVTVTGWDDAQGSRIAVHSAPRSLGPGAGRTGGQVLEDALVRRAEHVGHVPVRTEGEARALADTAHGRRARGFVRLSGTLAGDPNVRVGTHLRLTGTSPRFANTYLVVRTCHRYDLQSGYETDVDAECAYLGEP